MNEKADAARFLFLFFFSASFRFRKQCATAISTAFDYALRNTPFGKIPTTPKPRMPSGPPEPETSPPHSFWPSLSSLNKQSLARLRRCLLDPETTLATDYPRYTDEEPHVPLNLTDVQDEVGVDTRPCSLTSTKVILGNW
jgi:hypothetical protein